MSRLQNQLIYVSAHALRKLGYKFNEEAHPNVIEMRRAIDALEGHSIQFKIEHYPDGEWSAESTNIEGIMTGSDDPREAPELIKDAVYTYFEIPPHLCNDKLLRSDNEPATVEQTVHVGS